MTFAALVTMTVTFTVVTFVAGHFFYRVLTIPNKEHEESGMQESD